MSQRRYSLTEREPPPRRWSHQRLVSEKHLNMILALHHPRRGFTSHGFLSEDGSAEICVDQIGGRYHRNCTLRVYDFAPRGRLIRIKRLNPSRD